MTDARAALAAIGQLADTEIDIGNAALQLARIDEPNADWQLAAAHLSDIARTVVQRAVAVGPESLSARAEILMEVLADRYGYGGDVETYDDPANANLIRVTERRRGLPVALGILWLHAARAAGWDCHGVDFPAHFLVALDSKKAQLVIDVFGGGVPMSSRDLLTLLRRAEGPDAELRPGCLQPMSTRRVLLRLQNNIATRRLNAGDLQGGLVCTKDMLLIAPDQAELWRQAGLLNQRLEDPAAARDCYERFLTLVPEGRQADRVREQLEVLRSMLS
jgi:regulator of sirC expression with transglutaminase-like and TPR domain